MGERTCVIEGCGGLVCARGWCSMHYQRWLAAGKPGWSPPPPKPTACIMPGCARQPKSRGYCGTHHQRILRHGSPDVNLRPELEMDEATRFWSSVEVADCWLWRSDVGRDRYGKFFCGKRRVSAHRWAWKHLVGPIPDGLELDHLCKARKCVNPDHLEPVTHRENVLRSGNFVARYARRTYCVRGHPFDEVNTSMRKTTHGLARVCRKCAALSSRAHRARVARPVRP